MPAPSVHEVRAAITALLEQYPNTGNKKLCMLLNTEQKWTIQTKEFRQHLKALDPEVLPPDPEIIRNAIKALRLHNPSMGKKKFVSLLNTKHGWSLATKQVREYLVEVDSEISSGA